MADLLALEQRLERIENLLLNHKEVFNLDEVAHYTSLSKSYLYKLTSTGGIPCYRPKGKHLYFKKTEIDEWLLCNRIRTNEEIDLEASSKVTLGKHSFNKA